MQSGLENNEYVCKYRVSERPSLSKEKSQEETEVADPHSQTSITHRREKVCCLVEASGSGAGAGALAAEQIHRTSAVWPKST